MKFNSIFSSLLLLILLLPGIVTAQWVEGTVVGVRGDTPKVKVLWVAVGVTGDDSWKQYPPDTWNRVYLSGKVPADTKAVFVSTNLIITHGTNPVLCAIELYFKSPAFTGFTWRDPMASGCSDWLTCPTIPVNGQAVSVGTPGLTWDLQNEVRGADAHWVPVADQAFDFKWHLTGTYGWPENCAAGLNMGIEAYIR